MEQKDKKFIMMDKKETDTIMSELENIIKDIADPTIIKAYGTHELARRICRSIANEINVHAICKEENELMGKPAIGTKGFYFMAGFREGIAQIIANLKSE